MVRAGAVLNRTSNTLHPVLLPERCQKVVAWAIDDERSQILAACGTDNGPSFSGYREVKFSIAAASIAQAN